MARQELEPTDHHREPYRIDLALADIDYGPWQHASRAPSDRLTCQEAIVVAPAALTVLLDFTTDDDAHAAAVSAHYFMFGAPLPTLV